MQALSIGISKRELLQAYYPDEIGAIFDAWGSLHGVQAQEQPVSVMEFLNM